MILKKNDPKKNDPKKNYHQKKNDQKLIINKFIFFIKKIKNNFTKNIFKNFF